MRWRARALSAGLLLERVVDLFLDVPVVLVHELLFVLGQDSERYADAALLELDVEPVLTVGDAAWDVEVQAAEARAARAELHFVVGHGRRAQVGEETDAAGPARRRRKVVDRVALDLFPGLQRAGVGRPELRNGCQGKRLAVR